MKGIEYAYKSTFNEIYGNEDLVESMLVNLIDNAIKACYQVGGKIIFTEAFYRVDKSRSRSEGGNGLGLALCEEITKNIMRY